MRSSLGESVQTWTCLFCGDTLNDFTRLQDHLRLLHPTVDREVTQWPHEQPGAVPAVGAKLSAPPY